MFPFELGTVLGVNELDFDPDPAEQVKYKEMGVLTLAGTVLLFGVTQLCAVIETYMCSTAVGA